MSWINGSGFVPNDGLNGSAAPWAVPSGGASGPFPAGSPGYSGYGASGSDGVRPAWFGGDSGGPPMSAEPVQGGISAILAQMSNQVQQTINSLGAALSGSATSGNSTTGNSPNGNAPATATFQNVTLGSVGDPHLSVSGTEQNAAGGTTNVSSKFDSMTGHNDLFSTRDFGDGFRVATTVTQPAANGITQNASATASMDGGLETVTMTNNGTVSVSDRGQAVALAAGQSVTLSGGQQVSEAANGAVSITESAFNENLTTTFAQNGTGGVDVTAHGQNVTLGGALITGGSTPVARASANGAPRLITV
jgi:hypothetical protein